ncbi:MAG: hypothetical protein IPF41_17290 [Flavobacteriales bacterium]|nr:hypothetical protein [Flavobacteriales bacterium]
MTAYNGSACARVVRLSTNGTLDDLQCRSRPQ